MGREGLKNHKLSIHNAEINKNMEENLDKRERISVILSTFHQRLLAR